MFTLTKDGNLCKDGKETKPEMTVQEFMDTFGVLKSKLDEEDGAVFYDTEDSFNGVPCKVEFCFYNDRIMDVQIIISTEPFLDKCGDDEDIQDIQREECLKLIEKNVKDEDIQDIQREECLKLIEKNVKYREKDTDGKMHVMYFCKDARVSLLQEVMQAELIIIVRYVG